MQDEYAIIAPHAQSHPVSGGTHLMVRGNSVTFGAQIFTCAIGKGGFSPRKREGDGCTPLGTFPLRECWYRADRMTGPQTGLPLKIIGENDGWCDDPKSTQYNCHVTLPFNYSHERLWRDDHVYDLIVPLGYNDDPVVAGVGSAIFMHLARPNYEPTEGCIALAADDFMAILPFLGPNTCIEIGQS